MSQTPNSLIIRTMPWMAVLLPVCTATAAVALVMVDPSSIAHWSVGIAAAGIAVGSGYLVLSACARCSDLAAQSETLREQVNIVQEQNDTLRGQVEVLAAMREVVRIISDNVDFSKIIDEVFRILERLLHTNEICLIVKDEASDKFVAKALRRNGRMFYEDIIDYRDASHPLIAKALKDGRIQKEISRGRAMLVSALVLDREVAGAIIFVMHVDGDVATVQQRLNHAEFVVHDIATHIAVAIKTPSLHDRAILDCLTGLYSRKHFESQLRDHANLAKRYRKDLSLLMMDIDHFKMVNDLYGHLTGDVVLNKVAVLIKQSVRECDSVYRFGGEEVTVILPETTAQQAEHIAERLRMSISETPLNVGNNSIRVSVSIGVSQFDSDSASPQELVARADLALYAAKEQGRNKTCTWQPDGPPIVVENARRD